MNQREEVLRAWKRYSESDPKSAHLRKSAEFFSLIENRQDFCWDELLAEYRANYRDCMEDVVKTLVETDDPLILYNFVKAVNFEDPKEAEAARGFIRACDGDKHHASLWALTKVPEMHPELRKRTSLPEPVKEAVAIRKPGKK